MAFGLPGAFTPTCSGKHLPGFVERATELKGKGGVDEIVCLSVNDGYVMNAWGMVSGWACSAHQCEAQHAKSGPEGG